MTTKVEVYSSVKSKTKTPIRVISLLCFTISSLQIFLLLSESPHEKTEDVRDPSRATELLIRPQMETVVLEPQPSLCNVTTNLNLVIGVTSAAANSRARQTIRSVYLRRTSK